MGVSVASLTGTIVVAVALVLPIVINVFSEVPFEPADQHVCNRPLPDEPGTGAVNTSYGRTFYRLFGDTSAREMVVLVGGIATPSVYAIDYAKRISKNGFLVLTYDLYGRGYSNVARTANDERLFVSQIVDLLFALKLDGKRVHFVGASMGGVICATFADIYPERVASLTLVAPAGFPSDLPLPVRFAMLPYVGEFILPFFAPAFMERNLDKQSDGQQNCELVEYQKKVLRAEIAACEGYLESILSTFRSFNLFSMEPIYRRVATHSRPVHIIWVRQLLRVSLFMLLHHVIVL
uniref:AB hydrolase-1 domain-containing protein n=1 Tax=Palpitomonas bilix TaxID=652834 RepID=A0A7S3D9Y8_9EUKA|mmetsp:Transcript_28280/g.72139  ORF Transcript_28280/g.72139 Transcript_28280/m.72139 type:complete len:293 (+) Transcript_28280:157-1035(+)